MMVQGFLGIFQEGPSLCNHTKVKLMPDAHPVFRAKRPVSLAASLWWRKKINAWNKETFLKSVFYSKLVVFIVVDGEANETIRLRADDSTCL
ncbi:unnamed protein product [Hymenolepis diminuta]|uniref:Uncharacterized protein n=1 Tax=Hymenolepis diminuta TaxID=6216 RepID=A0A564YJQ2_HYMDI|nr:unnamed protein product [Hymenolepis diminuta]